MSLKVGSVKKDDGYEHSAIVRFIKKTFQKRTCKRFVKQQTDQTDSSFCCCGYLESNHDENVEKDNDQTSSKWDPANDTEKWPTDTFGEMEFFVSGRKISKYVRVDYKTNVDDLLTLMLDHWKLEKPNLLISVIGGDHNFSTKPTLNEVFSQGLAEIAETTRAWIITNGQNTGAAKQVGEAKRHHTKKYGNKKPLVALGITSWGCVENREELVDKRGQNQQNFNGAWPASYKNTSASEEREISPLDIDHTHFILVDNGTQLQRGVEIDLRARLEGTISKLKTGTEESVSIPVVCVVVEGGLYTLETVKQAIDAGTPAIIVAGSGGVADILAYACRKCNIKKVDVDGEDGLKQTVSVPTFEDEEQLWKTVARRIKNGYPKTDEKDAENSVNQIRSCINKIDYITILDLDGGSSAKDIENSILKALLKGKRIDQLRLALAWNRVDFAKDAINNDGVILKDFELEDLMFAAIVNNKVDFVKFFLEKILTFKHFLTIPRIYELYNHPATLDKCPQLDRIIVSGEEDKTKTTKSRKQITLEHVGLLMKELVGELFNPAYTNNKYYYNPDTQSRTKSKDIEAGPGTPGPSTPDTVSVNFSSETIIPECQDSFWLMDDHARHLFLWSILTRSYDLAITFWLAAKDDLALAVAAHLLLKGLRVQKLNYDETKELKEQIAYWKGISIGLLEECHSSDKWKTQQLLIRKLPYFGKTTTLKMAVKANNKGFATHISCQKMITEIWTGNLSSKNHVLKLLLAVFCPPIAPVLLDYDDTERNQPPATSANKPTLKSSESIGEGETFDMQPRSSEGTATKETAPSAPSAPFHSFVRSYFAKLIDFFQAPIIKFTYRCLSYLAFLLLYGIILLTDFYPTISLKEEILIAWVITILFDEIRQVAMNDAGYFTLKLKNYITDLWNVFDVITITTFITGLILRFIPVSVCAHCFFSARIILALSFMAFFLRILQMFSIHRKLGPKLSMIRKMVIDLFYFMIIFLVFISAYGIASHVILYPNQPLDIALARDVLSRPWWNIFGELDLDEVSGNDCNGTLASKISAETCASLEYVEYNMAQCADYKDYKCPSIDWLVPIIQALYVLIANILMINILIAMFSNTTSNIQKQTDVVWNMQHYHLVREYESRPILPTPLIVLAHVYLFIRYLIRRYQGSSKRKQFPRHASNSRSAAGYEERELLNWEKANAQEFMRKRELNDDQGSVENKVEEMSKRVDEILSTVKNILQENKSVTPGTVKKTLFCSEDPCFKTRSSEPDCVNKELQREKEQKYEEEKIKIAKEKLEKTMKLHRFARETIYPTPDDKSQCYRTQVPDEYVPWEVHHPDYKPEYFDSSFTGTDVDLLGGEKFNQASHQSWISGSNYSVDNDGFPFNPEGRTGLGGRGILPSWGPNHVVNVVITRWKEGEQNLLEFLSIKTQATDEQSIPEETTTHEGTSKSPAVRRCFERLFEDAKSAAELLFPREKEVYRGYLDDYRNTDNAWLETVVLNYYIKDEDNVDTVKIKIEKDINWKTIHSYIDAYGSHRLLLYRVANDLKAAF